MVEIYTTPSCRSCAKAIFWFKKNRIPYREKNLFVSLTNPDEIVKILSNTPAGFDSIISMRSNAYKALNFDFNSLPFSKACSVIKQNPTIIRRPIILDLFRKNIQVGYNKYDIKIFQLAAKDSVHHRCQVVSGIRCNSNHEHNLVCSGG